MKFECWIKAEYEIPDADLIEVISEFRKRREGEEIELFPNDLIVVAKDLGIGSISISDSEFECNELPLSDTDLEGLSK